MFLLFFVVYSVEIAFLIENCSFLVFFFISVLDLHGRDTALSHLVKPMERMLQYDRLLSAVLILTSSTHLDRDPLVKACSKLKEAQSHICQTIRDRENKDARSSKVSQWACYHQWNRATSVEE